MPVSTLACPPSTQVINQMASSSGGLNTNNISGISRNTMIVGGEAGKSTMGQKQTRLKSGIPMSGGKPM
jgi:hypothetical protein